MLVVVKKPRIEIKGEKLPKKLLGFIKKEFGDYKIVDDDESISVDDWGWYKKMKRKTTPGESVAAFREREGMTQAALAKKLGETVNAIHISEMEHGKRTVSKKNAIKLAELFKAPLSLFVATTK